MNTTIIIILAGVAVAVLGILLLRVGRQIALFLLALGGLGVAGAVAYAMVAQANATRQAAQAATVAATGQTASSVLITLLAVLLTGVVLVAMIGGGYLIFRLRRAERQGARRWMPGPNARWGQLEQEDGRTGEQWQQMLQQLLMLEVLRMLRDRQQPQYPPVVYSGLALSNPPRALSPDESDWDALLDGLDGNEWW